MAQEIIEEEEEQIIVQEAKGWFKTSFLKLAAAIKRNNTDSANDWLIDLEEDLDHRKDEFSNHLVAEIRTTLEKIKQNLNNKDECYALIEAITRKLIKD